MPQIAQQDNLFIDVTTLGTFSADQKAKLVECFKAGTILDVVQRSAAGVSKCISASYADVSTTRTYTFVFGGASLQSVTATETIEA
jgi:hypothetical protein